jgi:hypothetical protein
MKRMLLTISTKLKRKDDDDALNSKKNIVPTHHNDYVTTKSK